MTRVAILIPSSGQRALANLARDAIAKFTKVPHDVFLLDHGSGKWPREGGEATAATLTVLRNSIPWSDFYSHVFIMHDDSLPLRDGWLNLLLSKELPAAAIVSRRSGRGQSAGTLFDRDNFVMMDLWPKMPEYDVAESVPCRWRATNVHYTPGMDLWDWTPPDWIRPFACTLALDDDDHAFWGHTGGGTIGSTAFPAGRKNQERIERWIAAARSGLCL